MNLLHWIQLMNTIKNRPARTIFTIAQLAKLMNKERRAVETYLRQMDIHPFYVSSYIRNGKTIPAKKFVSVAQLRERFPDDYDLHSSVSGGMTI